MSTELETETCDWCVTDGNSASGSDSDTWWGSQHRGLGTGICRLQRESGSAGWHHARSRSHRLYTSCRLLFVIVDWRLNLLCRGYCVYGTWHYPEQLQKTITTPATWIFSHSCSTELLWTGLVGHLLARTPRVETWLSLMMLIVL